MISSRFSHGRDPSVSVEAAARQWRELYNVIEEIKDTSHAGSHFLSFYRDQMVSSADRLLELGLDVSDLHNPRVVPVPIARHPKTEAETRRWDAEISFRIEEHMLSFSVAGVGAHVVYSAVGDAPLVEVLAGYVRDASTLPRENIAALISMSNLEYLALACSLWLLEPTGTMKPSVADLDTACFNRMLYSFELNPLTRAHRQARDNKLPEAARSASANVAAGWSLANLSLRGKHGDVLRRVLGEQAPLTVQYERFLQELPSASLIAWEDREPTEPLRSTGKREKNLARRVAANIERTGDEGTTKPGRLVYDTFGAENQALGGQIGEALGQNDQLLEAFTLVELAKLEAWAETATFSEQEQRVYELDKGLDNDTAAIARELDIAETTVRVVRKNYITKIRKAAGL
jgi:hypothetical protein